MDILPQVTLLLLMIALIAVGILAYVSQQHSLELEKDLATTRVELQFSKETIGSLENRITGADNSNAETRRQLESCRQRYSALYGSFEQVYLFRMRRLWFGMLRTTQFRNRSEIGARLLYPMLRYLGYPDSAFALELPVKLTGTGSGPPAYVSCIVYGTSAETVNVPLFLLETVTSEQAIIDPIIEDTALKAFSTGVQKYVITNGDQFYLYGRGTIDTLLLSCRVKELKASWDTIYQELNPNVFQF